MGKKKVRPPSADPPALAGHGEVDSGTEPDPVTGLTTQELERLVDEVYEQRHDPQAWEDEEAAEISPKARSVVSVRFSKGELGQIERAAGETGLPVSTFIRVMALIAASSVHFDALRQTAELLLLAERRLNEVRHNLALSDAILRKRVARR